MTGGRRQQRQPAGAAALGLSLLLLLLLLAWACLALDSQQNCSRTQYEAQGRCCTRCPPGQKVSVPCTKDSDTVCILCQAQHFQDVWTKEKFCTPHRYCDQNAGLVVRLEGNASRDVVCQCQDGYHCSSHECQSCRQNQACGPGKGVEQTATDRRDTVCAECPVGFFSNISSATASCQRWSSCEASGLLHKANGTRFSDTVCEEAQRVRSEVVVPAALAAVIAVLGCVGLLLWLRHRRRRQEPQKWHHNQGRPDHERQEPEEVDAFPVQETLPTTPDDGKDSRLAEEECA